MQAHHSTTQYRSCSLDHVHTKGISAVNLEKKYTKACWDSGHQNHCSYLAALKMIKTISRGSVNDLCHESGKSSHFKYF